MPGLGEVDRHRYPHKTFPGLSCAVRSYPLRDRPEAPLVQGDPRLRDFASSWEQIIHARRILSSPSLMQARRMMAASSVRSGKMCGSVSCSMMDGGHSKLPSVPVQE